jgi:PIN domain nuclease of toxin-antitoxin system
VSEDDVVADASAVLAALKNESFDKFDPRRMVEASISAVNLCEVLTKLADDGLSEAQANAAVAVLDLRVHPFGRREAGDAADLRPRTRSAGLSLGDRACLALAGNLQCPAVTADRAWAGLDVGIEIVLIR